MRGVVSALLLPLVVLLVAAVTLVVGVVVVLVVGIADLLWSPVVLATSRRQRPPPRPRNVASASIVTVTWNGKHHLEGLLPSLRAAIAEHGGDHEVIVVDNGSTDGTVEWLRSSHPWVRIVALPENRYFVRGNKAGVEHATHNVLVFLNNDMVVQPGFLAPLLDGLRDPNVFAVAAEIFFKDPNKRREESGCTRGELRSGWLQLAHVMPSRDERELDRVPILWAGGGSAAFDRATYLAIGGFDELYDPFYMEDVGLSYEAWKRGFDVLFTAKSSVLHEHRGTSRKAFGDDFVDAMIRRNQHLFLWRNLTSFPAFTKLVLAQPLAMLLRSKRPGRSRAYGLWFELRAMLRALPRLPEAIVQRCAARRHHVRSDGEVFALANSIAAHRRRSSAAQGRGILVLAARLPRLDVDGSWIVFQRLVLQARSQRITLFAFVEPGETGEAADALRAHGIDVVTAVRVRNPMPGNLHHSVPHRLWRDYSAPAMRAEVQRVLDSTDVDVVQVEYVEMLHVVASLRTDVPVVYTCHESLALAAVRQRDRTAGLAWLAATWRTSQAVGHERALLTRVDHVVALSGSDAEQLRRSGYTGPIDLVPSAVDTARFDAGAAPATADAPPTVLFVGYFRHEPNVDAASWLCGTILPKLRELVPGVRVRLVGRDAPPRVQALARDDVHVAGFVPDLAAELAAATAVALPLRTGGGLRGKLLEAWAARKAVVTTRIGYEGTAARDGEHVLVADDATAFAAALANVLRDGALRERLGAAGRALVVADHSPAAVVARYDAIHGALARSR